MSNRIVPADDNFNQAIFNSKNIAYITKELEDMGCIKMIDSIILRDIMTREEIERVEFISPTEYQRLKDMGYTKMIDTIKLYDIMGKVKKEEYVMLIGPTYYQYLKDIASNDKAGCSSLKNKNTE